MVGTCVRCNSPCVQYVLSLKINNVAPMISYVFMGVSSDYSLHRYKTVVLHWGVFATQGALDIVWRHLWLSHLKGMGVIGFL